jgi:uncharacterized protein (TIRG00374 family)
MDADEPGATDLEAPIPPERSIRRRVIVRLIFLALTAFALYILWPSLLQVFSAWPELLSLNPAWFVVMLAAEIASFVCMWELQRIALRTRSWFGVATSQIAGNSLSRVVPGGAAAGAALQFRMLAQAGIDTAAAASGLTATSLIGTATLLTLPVLAIPAMLAGRPVPRGLAQSALLGGVVVVILVAIGGVLLSSDGLLDTIGRAAQWARNRLKRHAPPRTDLPERLRHERDAIRETLGASWWKAFLAAAGNSLFDYLALLAALTAVGSRPRPSLVLLAYVASMVLGLIPITPGGLGFVEAGLTATLALAGVNPADAVLATLAYRLVAYWLPLAVGPIAYALHRRRYAKREPLERTLPTTG